MSRRMFSTDIVTSDAFLDMGQGAQVLYFHLAMRADDDGFIGSPKMIMRVLGVADDELKVLLAKRFLLRFDNGVVVIKHWLIHNLIRADLYKETLYKNEKNSLGLNQNGAYTELRDGISELKQIEAPKWLKQRRKEERTANVPLSALRIGKDRIGKVSIDIPDWINIDTWSEWIRYRSERKLSKYTESGLRKLFTQLENETGKSSEKLQQGIDFSIAKGYQGIYYPKEETKKLNVIKNTEASEITKALQARLDKNK